MAVNARRHGKGWEYYFEGAKVNGKRTQIRKGGFRTKKDALAHGVQAKADYDKTGLTTPMTEISYADYLDFWYKNYAEKKLKYNSYISYKRLINNHLKPGLGVYKLNNITPALIQNFLDSKLEELSGNTLSSIRNLVSITFKHAVYPYQLIRENPSRYMSLGKSKSQKIREEIKVISLSDYNKILNFYDGSKYSVFIQIGFHTGMRAGEIAALTWDDINFFNNTISINKNYVAKGSNHYELNTPKTLASNRVITFGETLKKVLKSHKLAQNENKLSYGEFYVKSNYNFITTDINGSHINTTHIPYLNDCIKEKLNIDFHFHMLRHTHATMLIEAGANMKDVQLRLGHANLATTMDIYSHVTQKMKNETVDIFEKLIK